MATNNQSGQKNQGTQTPAGAQTPTKDQGRTQDMGVDSNSRDSKEMDIDQESQKPGRSQGV